MIKKDTISIASYGEALWDCIPEGLFLGGAPFNAAYHVARLGAECLPVTCVGKDLLGDQVIERASKAGMRTSHIKRHDLLETGVAIAQIDEEGNASYDIRLPSAWDEIELDDAERKAAQKVDAFLYGSLATRSEISRDTLEALLKDFAGLTVCDINLRPPFDDLKRAIHFARLADIVKLNHEELYRVIAADPVDFGLDEAVKECALLLGVEKIVVTLGGDGAIFIQNGEIIRAKPKPIEIADTIGAGDAFTAALTVFTLEGLKAEAVLKIAVNLGAYVASRRGAQPEYSPGDIDLFDND